MIIWNFILILAGMCAIYQILTFKSSGISLSLITVCHDGFMIYINGEDNNEMKQAYPKCKNLLWMHWTVGICASLMVIRCILFNHSVVVVIAGILSGIAMLMMLFVSNIFVNRKSEEGFIESLVRFVHCNLVFNAMVIVAIVMSF